MVEILKKILIIFSGIILGAIIGHIAGWMLSFLVFGDGSSVYMWLRKIVDEEPYVIVVLFLTVTGALVGGLLGYLSIKSNRTR